MYLSQMRQRVHRCSVVILEKKGLKIMAYTYMCIFTQRFTNADGGHGHDINGHLSHGHGGHGHGGHRHGGLGHG